MPRNEELLLELSASTSSGNKADSGRGSFDADDDMMIVEKQKTVDTNKEDNVVVTCNNSNNNNSGMQQQLQESGGYFITVETEEGNLEKLEIPIADDQFTVHPQGQERNNGGIGIGGGGFPRNELIRRSLQRQTTDKEFNFDNLNPELIEQLKKSRRRLVSKGGHYNVHLKNVPKKKRLFFIRDVFTTAIDMQWRYTILSFALSFVFTWTIFAGIWWLICYFHGDLETRNLPGGINQSAGNFTPCVAEIYNFASCYLFSVETQHTIGYGSRATTEECPLAIAVMSLQSIIGVLSSSCMAGIVFAKLARPKNRSHTVVFSKNAVVSARNGNLYLIFRIGNVRRSQLIESHVRVLIVHAKQKTREGESCYFTQEELKISAMCENENDDRTLLFLPCAVFHKIDESSPFYSMTPKDILNGGFEMVVTLEGIVEPTGNSVQARTSYLPREILWGYRFENMVTYSPPSKSKAFTSSGSYVVDCSYLNAVVQDDTPRLSMQEIDKLRKMHRKPSSSMNAASVAIKMSPRLQPKFEGPSRFLSSSPHRDVVVEEVDEDDVISRR